MIEILDLQKIYPSSQEPALKQVNLRIPTGSIFGIIGMSGAGKSTLVRCINLLERPTAGSIEVDGQDILALTGKDLRSYRQRVAMIFQNFGLLSQRNVLDNVCFPFKAAKGRVGEKDKARARELLKLVDLSDKEASYPAQLSGGQKQRVAIARALALRPDYLLCDEATSALDPASTQSILKLLERINHETGVTIIVITHDMDVIRQICTHVALIDKGTIAEVGRAAEVIAQPQSHMGQALLGKVAWDE